MFVDYNTLLLAIGIAGACLAATLFITWLPSRKEGFLLSWSVGTAFIVANVVIYSRYVETPHTPLVVLAFSLLLSGLAIVLGAAIQFHSGAFPTRVVVGAGGLACLVCLLPFIAGVDGLGFILTNFAVAGFLFATAWRYWCGRDEARLPILSLSFLYALVGASFVLCGLILILDGALVIGHAPSNWAEDLSLALSIAGLSGIGALSLALNQWRLARAHRRDALTDGHTGLLNRRALFDAYGDGTLPPNTAVIVFDLDGFKAVNDRHGHAAGDQVLIRFADAMRSSVREGDAAARVGGEEFAVVLPNVTLPLASLIAERVRTTFAADMIANTREELRCTVSAGVAFAEDDRQTFDTILRQADGALYMAKRGGRNRVVTPGLKLAS